MRIRRASVVLFAVVVFACGSNDPKTPDGPAPRTYRMGFSALPPRPDYALVPPVVDLWSRRADAAIMTLDPPWAALLAGTDPAAAVAATQLGLAQYFRAKGLPIWVYLEPANGLDRGAEATALVAAGRSITEPAVQQIYRQFAVQMAAQIHPEHMTLAIETNLIRLASTPALYAAIKQVASDAAADVRAVDPAVKLSISIQVDVAWGRASNSGFIGGDTDFADFPFLQELGLSSYPYLAGFTNPDDVPLDYYSRIASAHAVPVAVTEGGWTSSSLGGIASSPDIQRRYIARQVKLLDAAHATAWFQLTFTDLIPEAYGLGNNLSLFAFLGLVDVNLQPKPALSAWDEAYARPRVP